MALSILFSLSFPLLNYTFLFNNRKWDAIGVTLEVVPFITMEKIDVKMTKSASDHYPRLILQMGNQ